MNTAYARGLRALRHDANPYEEGTVEHEHWRQGWRTRWRPFSHTK